MSSGQFFIAILTPLLVMITDLARTRRRGVRRQGLKWTALLLATLLLTGCNRPLLPPFFGKPTVQETESPVTTRLRTPSSLTSPSNLPTPTSSPSPSTQVPTLTADPRRHPDPLGVREDTYEDKPVFFTQNHVTRYVLYQFLMGRFSFDFYLDPQLASDEGEGFGVLSRACETAMAYYLFSAYDIINTYTEASPSGKVHAVIALNYTQPDKDQAARQAAARFIKENPVPQEGFSDFKSERAYALKIHDFIARKITYSPIGYRPELMIGMDKYQACQEVYNVLVAEDDTAVCAGYARAFALIAQYAGINCAWVYGNENEDQTESHAWNLIFPCDGSQPVLVDVTWDDTNSLDLPGQKEVSRNYFYTPLSESFEHFPADHFSDFLSYMNEGNWVY